MYKESTKSKVFKYCTFYFLYTKVNMLLEPTGLITILTIVNPPTSRHLDIMEEKEKKDWYKRFDYT